MTSRQWNASGRGLAQLDVTAGLREALEVIGKASDRLVPVETGDLRASRAVAVEGSKGGVGYSDPKAVAAHENQQARLRGGKQAKFLETAVNESRAQVLQAIAADLRRQMGG